MADTVVNIPGVGDVAFPDSMSPDEINSAAKRLYEESQAQLHPAKEPKPGLLSDPIGYVAETVSNIPGSAADAVVNALSGIPAALWAAGKIASESNLMVSPTETEMVLGLGDYIGSRYGSLHKFGKTFRKDPVGVALDVAPLGKLVEMAGAATKARALGKAAEIARDAEVAREAALPAGVRITRVKKAAPPTVAEGLLKGVAKVGEGVEGIGKARNVPNVIAEGAVRGVGRGLKLGGKKLYRSALSPSGIEKDIAKERQQMQLPLFDGLPEPPVGIAFPEEVGIEKGILPTPRSKRLAREIVNAEGRVSQAERIPIDRVDAAIVGDPQQELKNLQRLRDSIKSYVPERTPAKVAILGALGFLTGGPKGSIGVMAADDVLRRPAVKGAIGIGLDRAGRGISKASTAAARAALITRLVDAGMNRKLAEAAVDHELEQQENSK